MWSDAKFAIFVHDEYNMNVQGYGITCRFLFDSWESRHSRDVVQWCQLAESFHGNQNKALLNG